MKSSRFFIACYLLYAFFILILNSCKKDKDQVTPATPTTKPPVVEPTTGDVIIPSTTKVLDIDSKNQLTSVDSINIVFNQTTPMLNTVEVGDVVATDITPLTPYGLLRKVLAKKTEAGQVVFETRQAKLTEAIKKGSISVSKALSMADTAKNGRTEADGFEFKFFEKKIAKDLIALTGKAIVEPTLDFTIKIDNYQFQEFTFKVAYKNSFECKAVLGAKDVVLAQEWISLAHKDLSPIVVSVGIVPIIIHPELTLQAGAEGKITSGVTTSVTASQTATTGFVYANGVNTPIKTFVEEFKYKRPTKAKVAGDVKYYLGIRLDASLYSKHVFNANADANIYGRFNVAPLEDPKWKLYGGVESNVGFGTSLFDNSIINLSRAKIFGKEILLAAGARLKIDPEKLEGAKGKEYTFTAKYKGNLPQRQYTWNFGDGTPKVVIKQDSTVKHTFAKPGKFEVAVSLLDLEENEEVDDASTEALIETKIDFIIIAADKNTVMDQEIIELNAKAIDVAGEAINTDGDEWIWNLQKYKGLYPPVKLLNSSTTLSTIQVEGQYFGKATMEVTHKKTGIKSWIDIDVKVVPIFPLKTGNRWDYTTTLIPDNSEKPICDDYEKHFSSESYEVISIAGAYNLAMDSTIYNIKHTTTFNGQTIVNNYIWYNDMSGNTCSYGVSSSGIPTSSILYYNTNRKERGNETITVPAGTFIGCHQASRNYYSKPGIGMIAGGAQGWRQLCVTPSRTWHYLVTFRLELVSYSLK